MAIFETESLVLKTYSLAEADKIAVFLTQAHGLIRGVAKGAKRLKSRFGGALEPFSIVNLTYYQKEERELVSISQIDLQKSFFEIASNPLFLQKFAYLAELLNEFVPPHEPNERIYRMTRVCLEAAVEHQDFLENISLYFEIWLLKLGGYLPAWDACDHCKKTFSETESTSLQINFHLLCDRCRLVSKNRNLISPGLRDIYQRAQRTSPANFIDSTKNKGAEIREVSDILKRIISHILGKDLKNDKIQVANQ